MVVEILNQACKQVYIKVKGLAGTAEGKREGGRGAGGDISRKIDLVAEKTAIDYVRKKGVKATVIAEESGVIDGKDGYLVIDSIDGTTNAISGIPFFCCSIAYASEFKLSAVTAGSIIDLTNGDLYYAAKGKGAFLNGKRIRTKSKVDSNGAIVGLNISKGDSKMMKKIQPVIEQAGHVRHLGANALELCYLAKGTLDAYVDFRGKIRATDMAAAYLIVREAGGKIYSLGGKPMDSDLGMEARMSFYAVANHKISKEFGNLK